MPDNLCWFGTLSGDIPLAAGGLGGWFFGERRRHPGEALRFGHGHSESDRCRSGPRLR